MDIELDPEDLAKLANLSRPKRAEALLLGEAGPVKHMVGGQFDPPTAAVAYLVHVAYIHARRKGGMLSGRPGWEATETLAARVREAASRSEDLAEFATELFRNVGASLSRMSVVDTLWWREAGAVYADRWRHLRRRTALEEVLSGVGLLNELTYSVDQAVEAIRKTKIKEATHVAR